MIDLGLTKIALIGAVALVVIGPEKLPAVARMAGTLFGRAQRYINSIKTEVNREMQMDEMRKMQESIRDAASGINKTLTDDIAEAGQELNDAMNEASTAYHGADSGTHIPTDSELAAKSRHFRKKKLAQSSSTPMWFKRQSGRKTRVISGAARVARYRPASGKPVRFFN
jgi:sec-independent protein translocase protein TatB